MRKIIIILAAFMLTACQTGISQLTPATPTTGPTQIVMTTTTFAATPVPPHPLTATPALILTSPAGPETNEVFDHLFQSVIRSANTIYVQDQHVYLNVGPILVILDSSDRHRPHLMGAVKLPIEIISNLYVNDGYAYVAASESGLRIVDVSDPAQPLEVGAYYPPLMAGIEKPMIWSGPELPAYLYRQGARAVAVAQTAGQVYAYVAAQGAGLRVVNVSDPTKPVEVGILATSEGGFVDVAVANGQAYLAKPGLGLQIVDISEPTTPQTTRLVSLGWPNEIWSIALSTNQANSLYVYGAAGTCSSFDSGNCPGILYVIDVVNSAAPKTFSSSSFYGYSTNIAVSHRYAYLLAMSGLHVLDISDPTHPQHLTRLPDQGSDIALAGNTLYMMATNGNLEIFDLTNPAAPARVGLWQPPHETSLEVSAEPTGEPTVEPTPEPTIEPTQ